tara:strand:+ start:1130 stop:1525 length:396 start_codon:yes stop_codon:yes gene_type:complete
MCSFILVYEKKAKDFPTPLRVRAEKSSKLINLTNKGRKHMATTFDIKKVPEATRKGPATWNQIRGLSFKFASKTNGNTNYREAKQIQGCLYNEKKEGRLTYSQAHTLFSKKTLPAKYRTSIQDYVAQQDQN